MSQWIEFGCLVLVNVINVRLCWKIARLEAEKFRLAWWLSVLGWRTRFDEKGHLSCERIAAEPGDLREFLREEPGVEWVPYRGGHDS